MFKKRKIAKAIHRINNKSFNDRVKAVIKGQVETKINELTDVSSGISETAAITDFTAISRGEAYNQREGNFIRLQSLVAHGRLLGQDTPSNTIRFVYFIWHPDKDEDDPTQAEIFVDPNHPWISNFRTMDRDPDERKKFTVLLDRKYQVGPAATGWPQKNIVDFTHRINLKNRRVWFKDAATTGTNHLYRLTVSDSLNVTSHPEIADCFTQVRYKDA